MTAPLTRTWPVDGPLDLVATLRLHRFGPYDPSTRLEATELWRVLRLSSGLATLHVTLEGGALCAEAWGPGAQAAVDAAPALCGLHDDPRAFAPADERLGRLASRWRGLRIPRMPDITRILVQTILQQRVRWQDAARSWRQLLLRHGEPGPGPGAALFAMPAPRALARLPRWAYAELGVEQRRADVIVRVATSHRRIEELSAMPAEAARARLSAFSGVGPWTTGMTEGFALGDPDAAPTGDLDLPHLVTWFFTGAPRGDDDRMLALLESHRPDRWRVIRLLQESGLHPPRRGPRRRLGPRPGV